MLIIRILHSHRLTQDLDHVSTPAKLGRDVLREHLRVTSRHIDVDVALAQQAVEKPIETHLDVWIAHLVPRDGELGLVKQPGVRPGARIGIMDYSLKKPDEWGNIEVVERAFSQTARWSFQVPGALLDRLYDLLASIRARPGLFIGGKFAGLKVYGFYREFDIVIEYDRMVECSIDLEGLI